MVDDKVSRKGKTLATVGKIPTVKGFKSAEIIVDSDDEDPASTVQVPATPPTKKPHASSRQANGVSRPSITKMGAESTSTSTDQRSKKRKAPGPTPDDEVPPSKSLRVTHDLASQQNGPKKKKNTVNPSSQYAELGSGGDNVQNGVIKSTQLTTTSDGVLSGREKTKELERQPIVTGKQLRPEQSPRPKISSQDTIKSRTPLVKSSSKDKISFEESSSKRNALKRGAKSMKSAMDQSESGNSNSEDDSSAEDPVSKASAKQQLPLPARLKDQANEGTESEAESRSDKDGSEEGTDDSSGSEIAAKEPSSTAAPRSSILAATGPKQRAVVAAAAAAGSGSSSSDSDSDGDTNSDGVKANTSQAEDQTAVANSLPDPYKPPAAYGTQRLSGSKVLGAFSEGALADKELWHIAAPASIPITSVKEISLQAMRKGETALIHKGIEYNFSVVERYESSRIILPPQKSDKFSMASEPFTKILRLQQKTLVPKILGNRMVASAQAPQERASRRPIPVQPSGLKMRYQAIGVVHDLVDAEGSVSRPFRKPPVHNKSDLSNDLDGLSEMGNPHQTHESPRRKKKHNKDVWLVPDEPELTNDRPSSSQVTEESEAKAKRREEKKRLKKERARAIVP